MTTAAFFAARRLVDRICDLAQPGRPLEGVQVAYAWPGTPARRCVYLGELPFTQAPGPTAGARDTLVQETGGPVLYVRVVQPLAELQPGQNAGDAVRLADGKVEQIVDAIDAYLSTHPDLLGPNTNIWLGPAGRRDYVSTDDEVTSSLRYDLTYTCYL